MATNNVVLTSAVIAKMDDRFKASMDILKSVTNNMQTLDAALDIIRTYWANTPGGGVGYGAVAEAMGIRPLDDKGEPIVDDNGKAVALKFKHLKPYFKGLVGGKCHPMMWNADANEPVIWRVGTMPDLSRVLYHDPCKDEDVYDVKRYSDGTPVKVNIPKVLPKGFKKWTPKMVFEFILQSEAFFMGASVFTKEMYDEMVDTDETAPDYEARHAELEAAAAAVQSAKVGNKDIPVAPAVAPAVATAVA